MKRLLTGLRAVRLSQLEALPRPIVEAAGATWVDLWPALADVDGALRSEMTRDHLHLKGPGYQAWTDVRRPHLSPFSAGA